MATNSFRIKMLFSNEIELPAFLSQKYIPSLDGLRAVAIVIVVIAHCNFDLQNRYIGHVFGGGALGVQFFFSISGFLITSLLLKEKLATQTISLKNFYMRRLLRIVPVYLLALLAIFILDRVFNLGIASRFYLYVLTFTENYDTETHWYTRHFWSLGAEMQFYFLFPFILKKSISFYMKLSLVLIISWPVVSFFVFHPQYVHSLPLLAILNGAYLFLSTGVVSILIGSLAAILLFKKPVVADYRIPFLGMYQAVALVSTWYIDGQGLFISEVVRDILISCFVVSIVCFNNSWTYKLLNSPVFKTIGLLSYSIYIWQQLFVHQQAWAASFKYGSALWFNLPVLMVVAYLSYHYFEKPFLKLKVRFHNRASAV